MTETASKSIRCLQLSAAIFLGCA